MLAGSLSSLFRLDDTRDKEQQSLPVEILALQAQLRALDQRLGELAVQLPE